MLQRDIYSTLNFKEEEKLKIPERKGLEIKMCKFIPEDHQDIIEKIEKDSEIIKYLEMHGNSYGVDFLDEFSVYLGQCNQITHLNLNNIFVSRLKEEIPKALLHLTICFPPEHIVFLDLSNNAIAPNGCQAISYFLCKAINLKVLLLNNGGIGYQGAQALEGAIYEGGKALEILSMARNRIEDVGAKAISQAIQGCSVLKELHLPQNFIRESMSHVLKAVQKCQNLQVLDVQDNIFYKDSADELGRLISCCKHLTALNINDCNLNEKMNTVILDSMDSLGNQIKLEKVGYKYNELYQEQPKRFIDILMRNKAKLAKVQVQGNDFDEDTKTYYLNIFANNKVSRNVLSKFESEDETDEECVGMVKTIKQEELQF